MEEDENYPLTDEEYGQSCTDKWEGSKFIWNEADLQEENRSRGGDNQIKYVKRMPYETEPGNDELAKEQAEHTYGIRGHPDYDSGYGWLLSLKSLYVPWHNEFLSIYIYLAFAIYFWVETFMIMAHNH